MKTFRFSSGLEIFNYRFESNPEVTRWKNLIFKNNLKIGLRRGSFINDWDKLSSEYKIYFEDRHLRFFKNRFTDLKK